MLWPPEIPVHPTEGIAVVPLPGGTVPTRNVRNGVVRAATAVCTAARETTRCYGITPASRSGKGAMKDLKAVRVSHEGRASAKQCRSRGDNSSHSVAQNSSEWSRRVSVKAREEKVGQMEKSKRPGGRSRWTDLLLCVWAKKVGQLKRQKLVQMCVGQLRKVIWESEK